MRRALLAKQVQQLVTQAGHARERDAVPPDDGRARREMGAEQLVGRVDEVKLHAWSDGHAGREVVERGVRGLGRGVGVVAV